MLVCDRKHLVHGVERHGIEELERQRRVQEDARHQGATEADPGREARAVRDRADARQGGDLEAEGGRGRDRVELFHHRSRDERRRGEGHDGGGRRRRGGRRLGGALAGGEERGFNGGLNGVGDLLADDRGRCVARDRSAEASFAGRGVGDGEEGLGRRREIDLDAGDARR